MAAILDHPPALVDLLTSHAAASQLAEACTARLRAAIADGSPEDAAAAAAALRRRIALPDIVDVCLYRVVREAVAEAMQGEYDEWSVDQVAAEWEATRGSLGAQGVDVGGIVAELAARTWLRDIVSFQAVFWDTDGC